MNTTQESPRVSTPRIGKIVLDKILPKASGNTSIEELEELFPQLYSKTTLLELEQKGKTYFFVFANVMEEPIKRDDPILSSLKIQGKIFTTEITLNYFRN